MPTLLSEAAAKFDAWSLTSLAQLPAMQIAHTRFAGTTPTIQLDDKATLAVGSESLHGILGPRTG